MQRMWDKLEQWILAGDVIFVKESLNELENQLSKNSDQMAWINKHRGYFLSPSNSECEVVKKIYENRNFQNNVSKKNILNGRPVADAFIVAKAKITGEEAIVVSREKFSENAAKIPNLCISFGVKYMDDIEFQTLLFEE